VAGRLRDHAIGQYRAIVRGDSYPWMALFAREERCYRLILSAGIVVHRSMPGVLFGSGHASTGLGEAQQDFRRWDEVLAFVIG
jgi:hypothetical protein